MSRVLITGCAGFIGYFTSRIFLERGYEVVGIDNLDPFYDPRLKRKRIEELHDYEYFTFYEGSITDRDFLKDVFSRNEFEGIINLSAKAGVRYSIERPDEYINVNVLGTLYLLEEARTRNVSKFLLASTSSIYAGHKPPFREDMKTDSMLSPYAVSKKSAENLLYTYHHLYGISGIVVRYFTVYGPHGRPDMSIFRFIYWMMKNQPVIVYGDGTQRRSFTFIEDIAYGTLLAYEKLEDYEIVNLGNDEDNELMEVLSLIESKLGKKADIRFMPFHKADMKETKADITKARSKLGWTPKIKIERGIERTLAWFNRNWSWLEVLELP